MGHRTQSDLILDLGMNICEDTEFYLTKGFRVVAVEANPALCEEASARFSDDIAAGRLTVLNNAVATGNGKIVFYVSQKESAHSTTVESLRDFWVARGESFKTIEVETISPSALIERFGVPHYIKIDIEGQDVNFIKGLQKREQAPLYISFEVDFYSVAEAFQSLESLGYRSFALVDQTDVPEQKAPIPASEGADTDYSFKIGCTGLFGSELPQQWTSAQRIAQQCNAIVWQYRLRSAARRIFSPVGLSGKVDAVLAERLPATGSWYDIHASLLTPEEIRRQAAPQTAAAA